MADKDKNFGTILQELWRSHQEVVAENTRLSQLVIKLETIISSLEDNKSANETRINNLVRINHENDRLRIRLDKQNIALKKKIGL